MSNRQHPQTEEVCEHVAAPPLQNDASLTSAWHCPNTNNLSEAQKRGGKRWLEERDPNPQPALRPVQSLYSKTVRAEWLGRAGQHDISLAFHNRQSGSCLLTVSQCPDLSFVLSLMNG